MANDRTGILFPRVTVSTVPHRYFYASPSAAARGGAALRMASFSLRRSALDGLTDFLTCVTFAYCWVHQIGGLLSGHCLSRDARRRSGARCCL